MSMAMLKSALIRFSSYHSERRWPVREPRLISRDPVAVANYLLCCWAGDVFDGEIGHSNYSHLQMVRLKEAVSLLSPDPYIAGGRHASAYMTRELVSMLRMLVAGEKFCLEDFL